MSRPLSDATHPVRKVIITTFAIIAIAILFCLLLLSVIKLGDLLHPTLGNASYLIAFIIAIAVINIVCCKIIKPVCEVKRENKAKQTK